MAAIDINAILANLPRSTAENPYYINPPQPKGNYSAIVARPDMNFNYSAITPNTSPLASGQTGALNATNNVYAKPVINNNNNSNKYSANKVPPNQTGQNLLNFISSKPGQGLARGLLEAGGYSTTPVSFSSALAQGMKYMNEAEAAAAAAKQQDFENQLSVATLNATALKNQPDQYRPLTNEERVQYGIPKDGAYRFNITQNKPESIGGGGTNVNITNEAENKGSENYFKTRGDNFGKSVDLIETTAIAADDDNQLLNRFEQLASDVNTGAGSSFLLDLNNWANTFGIDIDTTGLGALEALNSVSGRFVMQQVQKTKGAVSDREMAYFFKISANIGNSPLGNQLIINMARSINDRSIAENNLLQDFLSEQYKLDPEQSSYSLDQKWKKVREQFRADNQLFTGDIEEEIKKYYQDNGLNYTGGVSDMNKKDIAKTNDLSDFQKQYPNAVYIGETVNGKSQFKEIVDGKELFYEI